MGATVSENMRKLPLRNIASCFCINPHFLFHGNIVCILLFSDIGMCTLPAKTGSCLNFQLRWFYNPTSGQCETFMYNGCHGNENNFITEQDCVEQCASNY